MRKEDEAAFEAVIQDLCLAFNRPYTPDLSRVFWESLKWAHLADIKRAAVKHRESARKFPTPNDLRPEKAIAPPKPHDTGPAMSSWAIAANKILFSCCFQADRGFKPVGKYLPHPQNGYGLPLPHKVEPVDDAPQRELLRVKADYVRMAEDAAAKGEPWETTDFNRMCREGFQAIIARADAGA